MYFHLIHCQSGSMAPRAELNLDRAKLNVADLRPEAQATINAYVHHRVSADKIARCRRSKRLVWT